MEESLSIGDVLHAAWRRRASIGSVTILCGLAALFMSLFVFAPVYQARVRILALRLHPGVTTQGGENAYFRSLLENPSNVAKVLAEFGLDRPPARLTPATFVAMHMNIDMREVHYLITVRVPTPEVDRVANRLVEDATAMAHELARKDEELIKLWRAQRADIYRANRDLAKQRLDALRPAPDGSTKGVAPDEQVAMLQSRLTRLRLVSRVKRAQLVKIEEEMQKAPAAQSEGLKRPADSLGAEIAALENEQGELDSWLIRITNPSVDDPATTVAVRTQLLKSAEAARKYFARAEREYREAEYRAAEETLERDIIDAENQVRLSGPSIQVLEPAVPPSGPVSDTVRNVVVAMTLGFLVSVTAFVGWPLARGERRG
jgi:capsular polysaccharide biosynthesis protein